MSSADLKFIFICAIILTLWGAFIMLFAGEELNDSELTTTKEDKGLLGGIVPDMNLNVLNPFSTQFNSEFALINIFIFTPLLFGIVIIGLRFLRGV